MPYVDGKKERVCDDLAVESYLLEVEDADLTEAGLAHKWDAPKFTHVFLRKLQMIAQKYGWCGVDPAKAAGNEPGKSASQQKPASNAAANASATRASGKRPAHTSSAGERPQRSGGNALPRARPPTAEGGAKVHVKVQKVSGDRMRPV